VKELREVSAAVFVGTLACIAILCLTGRAGTEATRPAILWASFCLGLFAFSTPDLNGVNHAFLYRMTFAAMVARGFAYLMIDILQL